MNKILDWLKGTIIKDIGSIVDDVVTTKEEKELLKNKLINMVLGHALETDKLRAGIISDEAKGNFLQRTWRPILMLCFGIIIMFGWVIYPVIRAFNPALPDLEPVPHELWIVLQIGIGGYIVGRSAEKIAPQINVNKK
ncbi:3TM-type holin [Muricauda sp. MAR_2010_75]|uniref:3TM-type holin n=1 Tax=Allomuricauda sp. MAR_2010_75 TaxID=1250232 RepID=UPI000567A078|nr:3TM-type holin [Muricauda sp. MAR_2010_75]